MAWHADSECSSKHFTCQSALHTHSRHIAYRTALINQYPPRQTRSAAVMGHKSQTMDPKVSSDWLYSFQGWNASAARKASIALQRHGDWSQHCGFAPTSEIRLSNHYRVHTTRTTACPCLGSPSATWGFPRFVLAGAGERKTRSSCARDGIFKCWSRAGRERGRARYAVPATGMRGGRDSVFCIPFKDGRKKLMLLLLE
jgi:hypothetical protein